MEFYVLSRALLDVFGNVSAVLMLKKCMSEEEGGLREGLPGPEWKAYLSRPSRWKSCFLWFAFRNVVNVCRKAESNRKRQMSAIFICPCQRQGSIS